MAFDFGRQQNLQYSQEDANSMSRGMMSSGGGRNDAQNNERDRMQMNLDRAFSLLDDDKPKPAAQHYYGDAAQQRIGTAPVGGGAYGLGAGGAGMARSNYTGSDLGSEAGDTQSRRGFSNPPRAGIGGGNQYGVPELGLQTGGTFGQAAPGGFGVGADSASAVGTLTVGGSRRSGQKFLGGGGGSQQASQRSHSDNRSGAGITGMGSGGTAAGTMAGGFSRAQDPTYSHHMGTGGPGDLNFAGSQAQQSESIARSSFGAGGGLGGPNHLNQQNLGGLGGDAPNRMSLGGVQSEVGSMYRGGGDDDALSHYMGQSDYGGATEVGAQSLIGGQNTHNNFGGSNMASLKPPAPAAPGGPRKRQSEFARPAAEGGRRERDSSAHQSSGLPPRDRQDRPSLTRPEPKKSENYGSFLAGLGGGESKPPRRGETAGGRTISEQRRVGGDNTDIKSTGTALVRDRSSRRAREGDNDSVSNLDAVSAGSRRREEDYSMSPIKAGDRGVSQDFDRYGENTNRTLSQHPLQGTPQMGNQIYIQDMQQQPQYADEATRQLAADLQALRERHRKLEADWQKRIDESKQENHEDHIKLQEKHKQAETMLIEGKDQIRDSIQDALDKERSKMDEIHKADLQHKETQHTLNLLEQKKLLEQETKHLEEQLGHQTELKSVLDKLQQRTVDVGEIVQSNIKQRDDELKQREQKLLKNEREVQEELDIDIAVEEKKLEEEERKLQRMKEDALRQKQNQHEELNRMRENRKKTLQQFDGELQKYRYELQTMNESLAKEQKNLDSVHEKKRNKQAYNELENASKETEIENMKTRLKSEKKEFEVEQKERLLRDIQVKQIEIEDKKKYIALKEVDLRKDYRMLEKKKELLKSDRDEMERKKKELEEEKAKFEEQHKVIKETSEKLNQERDKVMHERAQYDAEREKVIKMRQDLDFEKSILQSEYLKAEEMEHELKNRQNMLNMFQYSQDQRVKDLSSLPYYQLGFGGGVLPTGQKVHELVAQQNNIPTNKENIQSHSNIPSASLNILRDSNFQNNIASSSAGFNLAAAQQDSGLKEPRFNYNQYIDNLQRKLAQHQQTPGTASRAHGGLSMQHAFSGLGGSPDMHSRQGSLMQQSSVHQEHQQDRFRDKILAKLGNVEDSDQHNDNDINGNFADGLEMPSDLDYGNEIAHDSEHLEGGDSQFRQFRQSYQN